MGILSVIAAAAVGWIVGAVWYGINARRWMEAAGLTEETVDRTDPRPYVASFFLLIVVSGMTRHIFAGAGIATPGAGLLGGLGLGLFIAVPWLVTNYLYARRSPVLMLIDGAYAAMGTAAIGLVLTLV
jgi:hypothetical protein